MSFLAKMALFSVILASFCFPQDPLFAVETYEVGIITSSSSFRFNNENWFTVPHPEVASFTIHDDGSAYGLTVTNVPFFQYNIPNTLGVRIQRFEIQDHYHYIIEGEIAYTSQQLSEKLGQILNSVSA
jgi:hypothetical protein